MTASAGNKGDSVRSDCFVSVIIEDNGGIKIDLKSKVKALYGESIQLLINEMLQFFKIRDAKVEIDDQGALPFVIAARLEAAVRMLVPDCPEYLLPGLVEQHKTTDKDLLRRSRLYLAGNNPKLMLNAGIYGADALILDLEDSVAPDKKNEARILVRNALRALDFNQSERMVRINQLPLGIEDLKSIIPQHPNLILIPKCESAQHISEVEKEISTISGTSKHGINLMPIIESALGIIKAFEIATASKNVVALAIGLEDYTADLGVSRTTSGHESFYARSAIVNAARAAGIQAIDSVFSDIDDMETLAKNVQESKALGFCGMGCIHPRQIPVIHRNFAPDKKEIDRAAKIVLAYEIAQKNGQGVVALGSKMIDPPVVKQAQLVIHRALISGIIQNNWRNQYGE